MATPTRAVKSIKTKLANRASPTTGSSSKGSSQIFSPSAMAAPTVQATNYPKLPDTTKKVVTPIVSGKIAQTTMDKLHATLQNNIQAQKQAQTNNGMMAENKRLQDEQMALEQQKIAPEKVAPTATTPPPKASAVDQRIVEQLSSGKPITISKAQVQKLTANGAFDASQITDNGDGTVTISPEAQKGITQGLNQPKVSEEQANMEEASGDLETMTSQTDALYQKALKEIQRISSGDTVIPLTASQQSLLNALSTQTEQNLAQMKESTYRNEMAQQGSVAMLGAQYSPVDAGNYMQFIMAKGSQQIAEQEVVGQRALADMEQGFNEDNAERVLSGWKSMIEVQSERQKLVQDTYEATSQIYNEWNKVQLDKQVKLEENKSELMQKMTSASKEVYDKIHNASNLSEAYSYAAPYLKDEGAFELSEGTARYDSEGNLVAKNAKTSSSSTTTSTTTSTDGADSQDKYANDIDALAGAVSASLLTGPAKSGFADAMSKARNDEDRLLVIANAAKIPSANRSDLIQTKSGLSNMEKAINLVTNGVKTGKLKAGAQYVVNLTGNQTSQELTELQSYLLAALQPYRNAVTGAAWSNQEDTEYVRLFGNVSLSPETLLTRMLTMVEIMKQKRVDIVASAVDPLGTYDEVFSSNQPPSAEVTVPAAVEKLEKSKKEKRKEKKASKRNTDDVLGEFGL